MVFLCCANKPKATLICLKKFQNFRSGREAAPAEPWCPVALASWGDAGENCPFLKLL